MNVFGEDHVSLWHGRDGSVRCMSESEYAPSPWDWVRNQVDEYEATSGDASNKLMNTEYPIIGVHSKGAKNGLLRKAPRMRGGHNGEWARIASSGGPRTHPV